MGVYVHQKIQGEPRPNSIPNSEKLLLFEMKSKYYNGDNYQKIKDSFQGLCDAFIVLFANDDKDSWDLLTNLVAELPPLKPKLIVGNIRDSENPSEQREISQNLLDLGVLNKTVLYVNALRENEVGFAEIMKPIIDQAPHVEPIDDRGIYRSS